jgi:hypothetical protein
MNRWAKTGVATACIMLAFACDEQTEVQRQTHELEDAQKSVAKELVPVHGGPEPGHAGADTGSEATRVPENPSPVSAPPPVAPARADTTGALIERHVSRRWCWSRAAAGV